VNALRRIAGGRGWILLGLLLIMLLVGGAVSPAFLSPGNLRDMLVQSAPAAIVACGMTLVIVTGEIDISVGSLMGLLAAVLGTLTAADRMHLPVPVGVAVTLLLGAFVGAVNGLLVTAGRVPSIIVTLGMLTALQGVTEVVMGGEWIKGLPPELRFLGLGNVLGVPVSLWTAAIVLVVLTLVARETPVGRQLYAVGSNPGAARLLGLPVRRLKLLAFTLTGLLTAVATIVSVPRLSVIEPGIGRGFELLVITGVVVGGTSIRGGRGALIGSALAVVMLGMVRTLLIFLRLGETATYWERTIQGAFILLAVLADHYARRDRQDAA
jgi:ribose/xylose/arabinose/galactoside ABC-type transport system permease subunit